MTDRTIDEEAELILTTTADELTGVRGDECLYCYVARMLDEHGCDNTLCAVRRALSRPARPPGHRAPGESG